MSDARTDYFDLKMLQNMKGFQKLQALWAHEYAIVMKSLQLAAAKNNESNWRFQAGILKGFDIAIGQLERAITDIERDKEFETTVQRSNEELLKELRGDKPQ
jgi:uncharacterized protein (UPF0335 family)